jgi:hypothetical protein
MSAWSLEDRLSTIYYWACFDWEQKLLLPSYSFYSVSNRRCEKVISSAVWFYCIQRIDWMIAWMIILCLQSHWEVPLYGNRCGNKRLLKNYKRWNKCYFIRTVTCNWYVVSEVWHFRNNVSQLEPANVTVTLLICVRQ